jgi:hypothetical protein
MEVKRAPWKLDEDEGHGVSPRVIHLITPEEFETLPDGEVLLSITGGSATKGKDYIDNDTRGGMLAYGLPSHHERCLRVYTTVLAEEFLGT